MHSTPLPFIVRTLDLFDRELFYEPKYAPMKLWMGKNWKINTVHQLSDGAHVMRNAHVRIAMNVGMPRRRCFATGGRNVAPCLGVEDLATRKGVKRILDSEGFVLTPITFEDVHRHRILAFDIRDLEVVLHTVARAASMSPPALEESVQQCRALAQRCRDLLLMIAWYRSMYDND